MLKEHLDRLGPVVWRALREAGERAVRQLREALKGDVSAEQRDAIDKLLTAWQAADQRPPTDDRLRVMRAIAALELSGTADARKLLSELAKGIAEATTSREASAALGRAGDR